MLLLSKNTFKKFLPNKLQLALLILAVVFSFVILEFAVRKIAVEHDTVLACRQSDPQLHHSLKPNSKCHSKTSEWDVYYEVNSLGIRDKEISPKADDEFRILVLGDSFTEGVGVNAQDRFTSVFEKELLGKTSKKINVINAGTSTYSPVLELEFLKKNLEEIKPDLVMVGLDMTDFRDEIGYYNFLNERNANVNPQAQADSVYLSVAAQINSSQVGIQAFKKETRWQENKKVPFGVAAKMFLRQSRFYVAITNLIKDKLNSPYLMQGSPPFIEGDVETDTFAIARGNLPDSVYGALWRLPRKSLGDFLEFSNEKNFKLAFFIYPHAMQVDGYLWGKGRLTRGFIRGQAYEIRPLDDLVAFGKEINVPAVSLLGDFRSESSKKLYFEWDGHFTPLGHDVAGKGLAKFILDSGLLN